MPSTFGFAANGLVTPTYLNLTDLSPGSGSGVNDPSQSSAIAPSQVIETGGDVDVFAVTLQAGQTYSFDVDGGAGDSSGGSVDLEFDLIDFKGNLVLSDDGTNGLDTGSFSTLDPGITVSVNQTGTYFVALHAQDAEYTDGAFRFDDAGSVDTGDYALVVSTAGLPPRVQLNDNSNVVSFGGARDNVRAGFGSDTIYLNGGSDVIDGERGYDTLFGGNGDDELAGDTGGDSLLGQAGSDVLVGGDDDDDLAGGTSDDDLSGGTGSDDLFGGAGNDVIWGDSGRDTLYGDDGNDFLRGGGGVDTLVGGAGADTFHFLQGESPLDASGFDEDRVLGFQTADAIDLTDLLLGQLTFRGTATFTGANQVRVVDYRNDSGSGFQEVRVNLDGNTSTSELAFLVDTDGNFTLTSSDFFL